MNENANTTACQDTNAGSPAAGYTGQSLTAVSDAESTAGRIRPNEAELPREKLKRTGLAALSDAEILALVFGSGTRGMPVMALSSALMNHFGSVSALLSADENAFCAIAGAGPVGYTRLQAAVELSRRSVYEVLQRGSVLSSPKKVREYLSLQQASLEREEFAALLLDNRHRVIAYQVLFVGTIDGAAVYPREVVKCCLAVNASAVIFAHNHPSGVAEPSEADIAITRKLTDALGLIDIRVLDHIVIGKGVQVSMAERGIL